MDVCAVDNTSRTIQASTHKDTVKNSPSLSANQEMTSEYEGQVRSYYRLRCLSLVTAKLSFRSQQHQLLGG